GGKDRALSASPDVLACPGSRQPPLPLEIEVPLPAPAELLTPPAPPPPPRAVAFQPWPILQPASRVPAPELLTFHQPDHPVSGEYRARLDNLLGRDPAAASTVLLLTSVSPGVGVTTTLLNLAISCAKRQRCVAAVDLNLCRPAVATRLGLLPSPGIPEVLAGT